MPVFVRDARPEDAAAGLQRLTLGRVGDAQAEAAAAGGAAAGAEGAAQPQQQAAGANDDDIVDAEVKEVKK